MDDFGFGVLWGSIQNVQTFYSAQTFNDSLGSKSE